MNVDFVDAFKARTKRQAVEIIKYLKLIKQSEEMTIIKHQLIKSATSVAANYRAACRGRSKADFISKLGIVHEEADETLFWLELLSDLELNSPQLQKITKESDEILRIVAKSVATSRSNIRKN
ncbi:MAG: four helix bundle protein [Bacteroidia bacterium]|nr:four helix bundle protein [Bacteroidia bacterium]